MSGPYKDFHGYHNFILTWVKENYGQQFMLDGLRRIGRNVYAPVSKRLAKEGLRYLADYWKEIFECEEGLCKIEFKNDVLILEVTRCPAIYHLLSQEWPIARCFCEHTRLINEEICKPAGFECSTEYIQKKGYCVQKFWPKGIAK